MIPKRFSIFNTCIHPASPGGAAHATSVFGSVLMRWWNLSSHVTGQLKQTIRACLKMVQTNGFCTVVSLFSFKNHVIYICLGLFRHKVGPKHKFLQCCFNVFFESKVIIYTFLSIKLVQNTGFCRVFSAPTSQIPHFCPFLRCQKPSKTTQHCISIPS